VVNLLEARVTNLPQEVEQQEPFVNHSIYSADRVTHLKIVVIALIAGIAVLSIGVRLSSDDGGARTARVMKAGKVVTITSSSANLVLCMSNNAAERELRAVAVGRRNWTFAGSDEGGRRAAAIYTLIGSAKLNDVDPQAWLADVLARINDHAIQKLAELLPWNWRKPMPSHVEAA
jgi:transposase